MESKFILENTFPATCAENYWTQMTSSDMVLHLLLGVELLLANYTGIFVISTGICRWHITSTLDLKIIIW